MNPIYINTDLSEKEQSDIKTLVIKLYPDANTFSFERWPNYRIVHFKLSLGWCSIMLNTKNKIEKISNIRDILGNVKIRLDFYIGKQFKMNYVFNTVNDAKKFAESHLINQKLNGYSTSFLEKIKYSLVNIITI